MKQVITCWVYKTMNYRLENKTNVCLLRGKGEIKPILIYTGESNISQ